MTLSERADSYAQAFAKYPASHLRVVQENGGDCLYGTWLIGNDYRNKTRYYGAYPAGYLDRVHALFPDVTMSFLTVLHAFSGSLPAGPYARCDSHQESEYMCSVEQLTVISAGQSWRLVVADPPYSGADAKRYGTPMVNRREAIAALAEVTQTGAHLVWLDCVWPQFSKAQWRTVGRICLIRSTNHRVRLVSIFERQ